MDLAVEGFPVHHVGVAISNLTVAIDQQRYRQGGNAEQLCQVPIANHNWVVDFSWHSFQEKQTVVWRCAGQFSPGGITA